MAGKRDRNRRYDVHGDGVETVRDGLAEIGMDDSRRSAAVRLVGEVLEANGATDFRWYKTSGKDELACYWGDWTKNVLWVTPSEVHIRASDPIVRPHPTTWAGRNGDLIGWLLPGAVSGGGGGRAMPPVKGVICPATGITQPPGTECTYCEVVHEPPVT